MTMQVLFNKAKVRLLAACCTFKRPHHLEEMLKSFYETKSDGTEIFIYLHKDDPFLQDYFPIVEKESYIIEEHRELCQAVNHMVFKLFPGIPYYQTIVDDMRYRTKNWDNMLIEGLQKVNNIGTASAKATTDENWNKYQHPSAEVYAWEFVNKIGYVYPLEYRGHGADYYMKDLCKSLNGLVYISEAWIEHLYYGEPGQIVDEVSKESYSANNVKYGEGVYRNWVKNDREKILSLFR